MLQSGSIFCSVPSCEPFVFLAAPCATGHGAVPIHCPIDIGIAQPGDVEGGVVEGINYAVTVEVTPLQSGLCGCGHHEGCSCGHQSMGNFSDVHL